MSTPRNTIVIEKERQSTTSKSVKQERKIDSSCISTDESKQQKNNAKLFIAILKKNKPQQEKLEKIKQLLDKNPKPNINAQDGNDNGNTLLHMAVNRGYLEIIKFLLQNGAVSTLENNHHKTPLMLARELNNQEIITALENHAPQARRLDNTADQQSAGLPEQPIEQQSEQHEEYRGNIAEVRVSDNDSQSGSLSDGKIQSILPPFSGELAVDTPLHLKLSRSNLRQSLEKLVKGKGLSTTEQLNAVPPYPTPYVLAQLASQAYQDYNPNESDRDYEKRLGLPEGWKLLTTAVNQRTTNGYFGAAYWHPERQQVVIAHRGTKPTTIGADWADIMGVVFKNYVPQMNSAATFADEVNQTLNELNKQPGVNFQLFFTGHSLGGWLSQITAFTTKYLKKQGAFFNRDTSSTNYHVHTVVFDSPGCEATLSQMQESFDVRYSGRFISLDDLDITSYLSAPNRINTCNSHLGTVYRIFTDLSDMSRIEKNTVAYTLATHRMDKILQAFNLTTDQVCRDNPLKIQEVINWPITARLTGGKEWKGFFNWAQHLNDYHPDITDESFQIATASGYYLFRYQTKPFDGRSIRLNVFTHAEQQFLERYHWLRELKEFSKPEDLFSEINDSDTQKGVQEKLQNFKIENEVIRCTDAKTLQEFIPYIKRLIQLFPHIQEKTNQTLSSFDIRKKVYRYETAHFLQAIQQHPLDINSDVIGLEDFLKKPQQRVWQLVVEKNTRIGLTKVYRSWQRIKKNTEYQRQDSYTILKLNRLLTIHQQISLSELLNSPGMTHHLLIVECNTDKILNPKVAEQLFNDLLNVLNNKPDIKIIIITKSSDGLTESFKQKAEMVLNYRFRTTKDSPLTWSDLTSDAQQKLLEKKVDFQGYQVALSQLIDPQQRGLTDSIPLQELINNQLVIGDRLPIFEGYDEDFYIDRTFNHQITIKRDIFHAKQQQKFFDLLASTEQDFKKLCRQHPKSNIHWLKSESGGKVIWQQSQGSLVVLREYIDTHHIHSYPPENLNDFLQQAQNHKIMLISDTAGMGKTTVLTRLSKQLKQKFPTHWVVRIDLNDHTDALKALTQQRSEGLSSDSAVEFVSQKLLRLKRPLEQMLFKQCFKDDEKVKVALLLDGFDEISPSYKDAVIDLLQKLRKSSVELWVTTRPHMKDALEDKLQQLSYTLEPFSPENQIIFLTRFWKKELTLSETSQQRLAIYAKALIEKLAKSISDKDAKFTGIPLQTRLLADSFKQEVELSNRLAKEALELPDRLDLLGLYERFIDKKYSTYQAEKTKTPVSNVAEEEQRKRSLEGLRIVHQQLALFVIFLLDSLKNQKETLKGLVLKIAEDGETVSHIAARSGNLELVKQLLSYVRDNFEYSAPGTLKNLVLATTKYGETLLHQAAASGNGELVKQLLVYVRDNFEYSAPGTLKNLVLATTKYGETLLHQAAASGNGELVKQLLDYVRDNFEYSAPGTLKNLVLATTKYGETLLHQAAACGNWELVKKLLGYVQDNVESSGSGTLKGLVLATQSDGETILHQAAASGNWELVKQLLDYVQNNVESSASGTLKGLVLATQSDGETILHQAAASGNWELVKQLLDYVQNNVESSAPGTLKSLVLATTKYGATVLHQATRKGHVEVLEKLWEWGQEKLTGEVFQALLDYVKHDKETLEALVLAKDEYGQTTLHLAAKEHHIEVVQNLLNFMKENLPETLKTLLVAKDIYGQTALHQAALQGQLEVVRLLIDKGADVAAVTKHNWTSLHLAAEIGQVKMVRLLIEKGAQIEAAGQNHMTSLHMAVVAGQVEVVQLLVEKGAQIEAVDNNNMTPLHLAVKGNYKQIIKLLLNKKANINAKDCERNTPLDLAIKEGRKEIKSLLEKVDRRMDYSSFEYQTILNFFNGKSSKEEIDNYLKTNNIDINAEGPNCETLLHLSIEKRRKDVFKWLLHEEADIHRKTDIGEVPLHLAARAGDEEIVSLLLDHGSKIDAINDHDETALHEAARTGQEKVVNLLLKETSRAIQITTSSGDTALHKATVNGHEKVVKILLDKGSDVNAKNYMGETALHIAVRANYANIVKLLLKESPESIYATTSLGDTVFHLAVRTGKKEMVQYLIEKDEPGSVIYEKNSKGNTAIHEAVERGNKEVTKLFLERYKNSISAETDSKNTPLHLAVKASKKEMVKFLLQNGGKSCVNARNIYRETPLHLAARAGDITIAQLLIENEAQIDAITSRTMLHYAVDTEIKDEKRIIENIKYYISIKIEINKKDKKGITALHLAARKGYIKVVEYIIKKHDADVKSEDDMRRTFIHYLASGLYRKCQEASKLILEDGISEDYFIQKLKSISNNSDFSNCEQSFLKLYNKISDVINQFITNKNHQNDIHVYDEEIVKLLNEIKTTNTNDKELISLLYSPAVLLTGLNTALLKKPSKDTLRKPELGIAISQLTKLHDSIDEYLNQSSTVTKSESKIDCDKLFNILNSYYRSNSNDDTGNNQMELNKDIYYIKNMKDIYSMNLIEKYVDPIYKVKDSQLLKFIIQRAFQVVGECFSTEEPKKGEVKEIVLSEGTKKLFKNKICIGHLPKLRNILSHVESLNKLFARMIVEKYYKNFDKVGNALKDVKDLVLEIRDQIENSNSKKNPSNNNDSYKFIKSFKDTLTELSKVVSESKDKRIRIRKIKEFLSDKEDFKKENRELRENFVQDKAERNLPNLLNFVIQDRLIDLEKQYNGLSINNDPGRLQAMEFFILDLLEAINFILFDENRGILKKEYPELEGFFEHSRLRNYLAHGDVLHDALMHNSEKMTIDNAKISLDSGRLAFSLKSLLINIEKDKEKWLTFEENKSFFKKLILSSQKTKFLEAIKNKLLEVIDGDKEMLSTIIDGVFEQKIKETQQVSLDNSSSVIEKSEHIPLTPLESEEGSSSAKRPRKQREFGRCNTFEPTLVGGNAVGNQIDGLNINSVSQSGNKSSDKTTEHWKTNIKKDETKNKVKNVRIEIKQCGATSTIAEQATTYDENCIPKNEKYL